MFYQLLDAAKVGFNMATARQLNSVHDSLYRGRSEEILAVIAPYLFQYELGSDFDKWLQKYYGQSWGVGIVSSEPMEVLHKHFRKFLLVKTDDGKELYFRFYDPRVLRVFLPTCDTIQLGEFFGPVQHFFVEDEDPEFGLNFWLEDGQLKSNRFR